MEVQSSRKYRTTIEEMKPPIASRPTQTSAKGLKPKIPSSTGNPRFSENCGTVWTGSSRQTKNTPDWYFFADCMYQLLWPRYNYDPRVCFRTANCNNTLCFRAANCNNTLDSSYFTKLTFFMSSASFWSCGAAFTRMVEVRWVRCWGRKDAVKLEGALTLLHWRELFDCPVKLLRCLVLVLVKLTDIVRQGATELWYQDHGVGW